MAGLFCAALSSPSSHALKIRFPDRELSRESVLPYFKEPKMILDRRVTLKYRVELGALYSYGFDRLPFYYPHYAKGLLSFYFSESQGISLTGTYFPPVFRRENEEIPLGADLTQNSASQASTGQASEGPAPAALQASAGAPKNFRVQNAPYPLLMGFLNYQYAPYYGKISLAKRVVMNLSIYGFAGPGMILFNDNLKAPALNIGIGQKLYLTKWLAVRGDIVFYGYYGPHPSQIKETMQDAGAPSSPLGEVQADHKRAVINVTGNVGLIVLI